MSCRLVNTEANLIGVCRASKSCLRQEAQSSTQRPFSLSKTDRNLLLAITSHQAHLETVSKVRRRSLYLKTSGLSRQTPLDHYRLQRWHQKFRNDRPAVAGFATKQTRIDHDNSNRFGYGGTGLRRDSDQGQQQPGGPASDPVSTFFSDILEDLYDEQEDRAWKQEKVSQKHENKNLEYEDHFEDQGVGATNTTATDDARSKPSPQARVAATRKQGPPSNDTRKDEQLFLVRGKSTQHTLRGEQDRQELDDKPLSSPSGWDLPSPSQSLPIHNSTTRSSLPDRDSSFRKKVPHHGSSLVRKVPMNGPFVGAKLNDPSIDVYTNGHQYPRETLILTGKLWQVMAKDGHLNQKMTGLIRTLGELQHVRKIDVDAILECVEANEARQVWLNMSRRQRILAWRSTVLISLSQSPRKTLMFLEASYPHLRYVPRLFIFSMNFIRWWRWDEVKADPDTYERFNKLTKWAIEKSIDFDYLCSWRAVPLFIESCTQEQGRKFFDMLCLKNTHMSKTMGLRFMNFFIAGNDVEYALKAFREVSQYPEALQDDFTLRTCSKLLRLDYVEHNDHSQNFRILPELLEAGLDPNLIIYNITLSNTVKFGLSNVLWDIFGYMQQKKLPADSYTYLALLRDCVKTGNSSRLSQILFEIGQRENLSNEIHIIGHTLHAIRAIAHGQEQGKSPNAFDQVLSYYREKLQLTPLHNVLQLPLAIELTDEQQRIEPTDVILQMMTYCYIVTAATPSGAVDLWHRFRHHIGESDPAFVPLVRDDQIYKAFAIFFSRQTATLPQLLEVIQFALHEHPPWHCKVSGDVFTIAAVGLLRHRRRDEAKDLLALMKSRGMKPDMAPLQRASSNGAWADARVEAMIILKRLEREMFEQQRGRESSKDLENWAQAASFHRDPDGPDDDDDGRESLRLAEDEGSAAASA